MAKNNNLSSARKAKQDEFYTMYPDIEKEMNAYIEYDRNVFRDKVVLLPCDDPEWSNFTKYFVANFDRLGLKKLISTSYAQDSKPFRKPVQLSLLEMESPDYDPNKTNSHGKIYTLTRKSRKVDKNDLKWKYLEGDGDFRSEEVQKLCDQADIIITNPPFSLFREFLAWVVQNKKQFLIIGNMNCITYKEVFPLIQNGEMWLGESIHSGDRAFQVPPDYPLNANGCGIDKNGVKYIRVKGVRWFTNLDHGGRHEQLELMTMADNKRYNKKLLKCPYAYEQLDNYKAIEVPTSDSVPADYNGVMAVPISFMDRITDQFEIVGRADANIANEDNPYHIPGFKDKGGAPLLKGSFIYKRILIKHKRS